MLRQAGPSLRSHQAYPFFPMSSFSHGVTSVVQDLHSRIALVLLLGFLLLTVFSITENNIYTPDSARYAIWAASLSQGDGFIDWTNPEPSRYVVHAPLYPIVLSPFAWISGPDLLIMKYGSLLIAVLMLFAFHRFLVSQTSGMPALVTLGFLAFNPLTVLYSTQLLSESLFLLLLVLLFTLLYRLASGSFADLRLLTAMVIVLGACILTREIGIVLLPVVLLFLLMHKRYDMAGWTFVGVILMFGLWYVRNEIIIAGREQPDLRNSVLFGSNILTSGRDAFLQEIMTRISVNGSFYLRELHGLLFFPQFGVSSEAQPALYAVVDRTSPYMQFAQRVVTPGFILVALGAAVIMMLGAVQEFRKGKLILVYSAFLATYGFMLLLYPVSDIRFLFPVLLVMLILIARGIQLVMSRGNIRILRAVYAVSAVAMVPNLIWCVSYAAEASAFRTAASNVDGLRTRSEYAISLDRVGAWFREQGVQPPVVIALRKELGIVMPGTKVLLLSEFAGLSTFEQMIRDYDVPYIVAMKDAAGWHDYEIPMNLCRRYTFRRVHDAGGCDIYQIVPVSSGSEPLQTDPAVRYMFHHFEQGNFPLLRDFFRSDPVTASPHHMLRFYEAVTLEVMGSFDSARTLFASLQGMPQGIGLARQIGFHSSIMDQLEEVQRTPDSLHRAELLFNIAVNFWEVDMRTTALQYLNATVMQHRSYIPAYNLFIHFSLQHGDTVNARGAFTVMSREFPQEPAVPLFAGLFELFDAIPKARTAAERADLAERLASLYEQLGLSDAALSALRTAHLHMPEREGTAALLAARYQERLRFYPARLVLERTLSRNPASTRIADALSAVAGRY